MDLRKLKKLIDLVEESGIAEIEVTEGEEKVLLLRLLYKQFMLLHRKLLLQLQLLHQLLYKIPITQLLLLCVIYLTHRNHQWLVHFIAQLAHLHPLLWK